MNGDREILRRSIYTTLSFVAVLWSVKVVEFTFDYNFGEFGIYPRTLRGSIGIITAPFIHGDIFHLISNSFPILILGVGLFYFYHRIAVNVVLIIYLATGFWVWLAAREAYHIGASGIVYGILTFLLFSGFFRRDSSTLAISFIVLFLYGGTFFAGIIPETGAISWESHLTGAVAGIFCAFYYKKYKIEQGNDPPDDEEPQDRLFRYHYKKGPVESSEDDEKIYIIKYIPGQSSDDGPKI